MKRSTKSGFTSAQVVRLTGVKAVTLHYWDKSGFLSPSVAEADGRGTRRIYNFRDILSLKVTNALREAGISLQAVRRIVSFLGKLEGVDRPLAETFLVTDGKDVFMKRGKTLISALREPGQGHFHFILDLSGTVEELRKEIKKLVA